MFNLYILSHVVSPCDNYKCLNEGECTIGDDGEPSCKCKEGFTGEKCGNAVVGQSKMLVFGHWGLGIGDGDGDGDRVLTNTLRGGLVNFVDILLFRYFLHMLLNRIFDI